MTFSKCYSECSQAVVPLKRGKSYRFFAFGSSPYYMKNNETLCKYLIKLFPYKSPKRNVQGWDIGKVIEYCKVMLTSKYTNKFGLKVK